MTDTPILWSFRRCPYAMRARLAVWSAGLTVELREILLKEKPTQFLETSASATVPSLRLSDDAVIDESLDIMIWALKASDPEHLLEMPNAGWDLIAANDGPFKAALDRTKYATRYPGADPDEERGNAARYLERLNDQLGSDPWLFGARASIADLAILPFVRQFAHIDRAWFDAQPWPSLITWLDRFLAAEAFVQIMQKYKPWSEGAVPVWFGRA